MKTPTIHINMLYWSAKDPIRIENVQIAWHHLKKFIDFCKKRNLSVQANCFNISTKRDHTIEDDIFIQFPYKGYFRSAKINRSVEYIDDNLPTPDFIAIIDSDLVIQPYQYQVLADQLSSLQHNKYYVCTVLDSENRNAINTKSKHIDFKKIKTTNRLPITQMSLGGLCIIPLWAFKKIEGYDEAITKWGGEDNIAEAKLTILGLEKAYLNCSLIHLYHESLEQNARKGSEMARTQKKLWDLRSKINAKGLYCEVPGELIHIALNKVDFTKPSAKQQLQSLLNELISSNAQDTASASIGIVITHIFSNDKNCIEACKNLTFDESKPLILMKLITHYPLHCIITDIITHNSSEQQNIENTASAIARWYTNISQTVYCTFNFYKTLKSFGIINEQASKTFTATKMSISPKILPYLINEYKSFHDIPQKIEPSAFKNCFTTKFFDTSNLSIKETNI